MMFMRFWQRQNSNSNSIHHQTSLECPLTHNNTTTISTSTSSFLYNALKKLVFFMFLVLIWGITAISFPILLLFPLISLPIIRLFMFFSHGETYTILTQLKLIFLNFTYYYFMLFIFPLYILFSLTTPSELRTSFTFLDLSLDVWICIVMAFLAMFGTSFHLSILAQLFPQEISLDLNESGVYVSESLLEIANCLLVFYVNVESYRNGEKIPFCKTHEILGLHTWKWIEAFIFVLIIHNIISLFTYFIVWLLRKLVYVYMSSTNSSWYVTLLLDNVVPIKEIVYWANGVKHDINLISSLVVVLFTWVLYFGLHLNTTPDAQRVLEFGTLTCLSLLIAAFLWFVKTCVILSWEARSMYTRLVPEILQRKSQQLYFLGIIGRHYKYDIYNLELDNSSSRKKFEDYLWILYPVLQSDSRHRKASRRDLSVARMNRAKDYLLMQETKNSTIYGIRQAALNFLMAKDKLLDNNYTSNILHNFKSCGPTQDDENGYERAHNNCLLLANTLSNAKDVSNCLDKILSWLIIIVSFTMWLHLTKLATIQELLVMASPFMVATIIFRDACNTLVKGFVFVYLMHPFDIGDLCVIHEKMMEVGSIDIWKTRFLTIDTQEEVIYSNSFLYNINIVNFKSDFDWSCSIVLEAGSLGTKKVKDLKRKIEGHLNKEDNFAADYNNHVEVVTVGDNIKMVVKFKFNIINMKNYTFNECFKAKCKLHSEFTFYVQSLMDQIKLDGSKSS
ncbi:Mechanosensitive ion channel protein 9, partial [Bienertia sinuspersici]